MLIAILVVLALLCFVYSLCQVAKQSDERLFRRLSKEEKIKEEYRRFFYGL